MHKPVIMAAPSLWPHRCLFCGTHKGPMLDTQMDDPADPQMRVYVCVAGCLDTFAKVAGYVSADEVAERDRQFADSVAEVADLEAALSLSEEQKVVPVGELLQMIAAQRDAQPAEPLCSATKKNGEPCTAAALPGRDTCVAHSRVAA